MLKQRIIDVILVIPKNKFILFLLLVRVMEKNIIPFVAHHYCIDLMFQITNYAWSCPVNFQITGKSIYFSVFRWTGPYLLDMEVHGCFALFYVK